MKGPRFPSVALLLAFAALLIHIHGSADIIPPSEPVSQVPNIIGGWFGRDLTIDQETREVLGSGSFLSRIYNQRGASEPIGLFIAYFPTQRTGSTIHSPKNCLPGAGWSFESSRYVDLKDDAGQVHQVGEYVIANGDEKQFVIYWYLAHGRSVANEYKAKFYLVADAIRMNRTDGALIRVMTPVDRSKGTAAAKASAEAFTGELMPLLPRFVPN